MPKYFDISEAAAKRAKDMNSYSDYAPGSEIEMRNIITRPTYKFIHFYIFTKVFLIQFCIKISHDFRRHGFIVFSHFMKTVFKVRKHWLSKNKTNTIF